MAHLTNPPLAQVNMARAIMRAAALGHDMTAAILQRKTKVVLSTCRHQNCEAYIAWYSHQEMYESPATQARCQEATVTGHRTTTSR